MKNSTDEISEDQIMNDLAYRKMKKKLEKQFSNKYVVIAEGKFLGAEDSLEKAWVVASPYKNAIVTNIAKRPLSAKIRGSSMRISVSKDV